MEAPIAPAAMRRHEEGPTYDLISLGLVTLTLLVVGIWCRHLFHDSPDEDLAEVQRGLWKREHPGADIAPPKVELSTSLANLEVARWVDFKLQNNQGNRVPELFLHHLDLALKCEGDERAALKKQSEDASRPDEALAASGTLAEQGEGPVLGYARSWYRERSAWLDGRDRYLEEAGLPAYVLPREDLAEALAQIGLVAEMRVEVDKLRSILAREERGMFDTNRHAHFARLLYRVGLHAEIDAEIELMHNETGISIEELKKRVETFQGPR